MKHKAIKVENLSKLYRLGQIGTGTLSHDLNRYWHRILGKEDPYLKIGETNDRTKGGNSDYIWSLKDVSFEVDEGDAVGIIGRNGAGKSTLLKIMSKITKPTTGKIKINGSVASLLEVGTGFNPEMTGRENIYLNGAILGMRRREIFRKLDEIIDFSGVERYIDTPVKRYSSGMYVRLAFAVAAHLESKILIVDEVLAVGDAEFQKKCLGKMGDVRNKDGRTVLFVSHNMNSIKHLCNRGILLNNGQVYFNGSAEDAVKMYIDKNYQVEDYTSEIYIDVLPEKPAQITKASVKKSGGFVCSSFDINDDIYLEIEYEIREKRGGLAVAIDVFRKEVDVFRSFDCDNNPERLEQRELGKYLTKLKLPKLKAGIYQIEIHIGLLKVEMIDLVKSLSFEVIENSVDTTYKSFSENRPGVFRVELDWDIEKLSD